MGTDKFAGRTPILVNVPLYGVVDVYALLNDNARLEKELHLERQVSTVMDAKWTPSRPVPPQLAKVLEMVVAEYHRAKAKHGEMTMDGTMTGDRVRDDALRLAALMEEVGEVAHELTYDSQPEGVEGGQLGRLLKEMVQVGNVAVTWASALVPGPAAQMPAVPMERFIAGTLTTARLAQPQEAYETGSTVRVPPGTCGVMVPKEKLRAVFAAMQAPEPRRAAHEE